MNIRLARIEDIGEITRIFNEGIEDRIATLDIHPKTVEERTRWFLDRGEKYKVLVICTDQGAVAGWASLNQFSPRACYDWVADVSVYVERKSRGKGLGKQLLKALTDLAVEIGFYKMTLTVFDFNAPGIAAYEKSGFATAGMYTNHGYFEGRLANVVLMEKFLGFHKEKMDAYYSEIYRQG